MVWLILKHNVASLYPHKAASTSLHCENQEPNKQHAVVMARFAKEIMYKIHEVTSSLEVTLGPDTGWLVESWEIWANSFGLVIHSLSVYFSYRRPFNEGGTTQWPGHCRSSES